MPSNFQVNGTDTDNIFLQRSYTILDDIALPGGVWAWGINTNGELGQGDVTNRSSPVQVGTTTTWKQISSGISNVLAVKTDGTLWAWGRNYLGALGLGDLVHRSSPVQVGSLTNWKQTDGGFFHGHAVKTDGTLWSWGYNTTGALGIGNTYHRSSPTQVGALTDWKQVSAGRIFAHAVKTDGSLWGWGRNYPRGYLGIGNVTNQISPVQVGTSTSWKQVSSGSFHAAAIKIDGTLWSWGNNVHGALGLGDTTDRSSPVQIGTLSNWKQVSCGQHCTFAVKTDGTLWSWGRNENGVLGLGDNGGVYGLNNRRSSPVQIGSLTNWKSVFKTYSRAIAVKTDGTLWSWGNNAQGQLGLGDTVHRSSPVQIGSLTTWKQASSQSAASFGILSPQ